jgi:hypothetical protein
MCALSQQKCGTVYGRDRKGSCLMPMLAVHPCIHSGTLSLPNRASRTVSKVFSCFLSVKSGFPVLLVSRVSRRMFFGALPVKFSAHAFLKSTSTDLGGGGLVQAGGLGAVWRSLVSPQHCTTTCFVRLRNPHASVWQGTPPIYWRSRWLFAFSRISHSQKTFSSVFVGVRMSLIV